MRRSFFALPLLQVPPTNYLLVILIDLVVRKYNEIDLPGAGPCVAVLKPQDGVGIVSADAEKYRIEILVFRSNNNPKIKLWRSKQRDQVWSLDISWFRLLESKVKIPLLECRFVFRLKILAAKLTNNTKFPTN